MLHVFNLIRFLVFLSVWVRYSSCDCFSSSRSVDAVRIRWRSEWCHLGHLSSEWRQMMHYGNCRTKVRSPSLSVINLHIDVSPPRNKLTSTCVSYRKTEFKGTVHPNKDALTFSHPLLHDWTASNCQFYLTNSLKPERLKSGHKAINADRTCFDSLGYEAFCCLSVNSIGSRFKDIMTNVWAVSWRSSLWVLKSDQVREDLPSCDQ